MNREEAKKIYEKNIVHMDNLVKELYDLKAEMDKAEAVYFEKLKSLRKSGVLSSGGYIVKGDEDESFLETLHELEEYEEDRYAGIEKNALKESKIAYMDKLFEISKFKTELDFAKAALDKAESENVSGRENE